MKNRWLKLGREIAIKRRQGLVHERESLFVESLGLLDKTPTNGLNNSFLKAQNQRDSQNIAICEGGFVQPKIQTMGISFNFVAVRVPVVGRMLDSKQVMISLL